MNFYFLTIVFLYFGEINARVVPLDFKVDNSNHVDSNFLENEAIDESPLHEVEILGHSIPHVEQSNEEELSSSEEKDATVLEISSRNASDLPFDLTTKEKDMSHESKHESAESSEISGVADEEFKSVSEFISKNLDSKNIFEVLQNNKSLNDNTTEDLTFKNETDISSNSLSSDLKQENGMDVMKTEVQVLNDNSTQSETLAASDVSNDDHNETLAAFQVSNDDHNETLAAFEGSNDDHNETLAAFEGSNDDHNETLAAFEGSNDDHNETLAAFEGSNDDHNETLAAFEVGNDDRNETLAVFEIVNGTNGDDFPVLQPLSNDTKIEKFLSEINITDELKNLESGNLEPINDSAKTAGGILSGFDFLINSEVAKNAAKAMEVFNFSDPLTDHIMEENEFHSFLPAFNAGQDLDSSNRSNLETSAIITNSTGNSNETRTDINMSLPSGDEASIMIGGVELKGIKKGSSILSNGNELLEGRNKTGLTDLAETFVGNSSSEGNSSLEITKASEATPTKQMMNDSVSVSSPVGSPECPPAGWCIFWFLSQDTCAVNEHCLGSRICCKIGCSKTCIEIESL